MTINARVGNLLVSTGKIIMFETYRIGFYCKQKLLQIHVGAQSLKDRKTTPFMIAIFKSSASSLQSGHVSSK